MPPIPSKLSPECQDFLRLCFIKNPQNRPRADELLLHPWISSHQRVPLPGKISLDRLSNCFPSKFAVCEQRRPAKHARNLQVQSFDELMENGQCSVPNQKFISSRHLKNISGSLDSKTHLLVKSDLSKKLAKGRNKSGKFVSFNQLKRNINAFNPQRKPNSKKLRKVFKLSKQNSFFQNSLKAKNKLIEIHDPMEQRSRTQNYFSIKKRKNLTHAQNRGEPDQSRLPGGPCSRCRTGHSSTTSWSPSGS